MGLALFSMRYSNSLGFRQYISSCSGSSKSIYSVDVSTKCFLSHVDFPVPLAPNRKKEWEAIGLNIRWNILHICTPYTECCRSRFNPGLESMRAIPGDALAVDLTRQWISRHLSRITATRPCAVKSSRMQYTTEWSWPFRWPSPSTSSRVGTTRATFACRRPVTHGQRAVRGFGE